METIKFECEVITPMFLAGADGTTPELRPASIKGALRFWWRAMHGDLEWKKMAEAEGKIFGDTKQRSSLIIMIEKSLSQVSTASMLPHKDRGSIGNCFPVSDNKFAVRLSLTNKECGLDLEQMKSLFILTCVLGGLGKRSRRGFGSVKVTSCNTVTIDNIESIEQVLALMYIIKPNKFKIENGAIKPSNTTLDKNEFPYITAINIGSNTKRLSDIGSATHDVMASDVEKYKSTVGAGRPRFASPIYISMLPNQLLIITTLKTVSNGSKKWDLQSDLKSKLL